MSGGSWDYLYSKELDELLNRKGSIQQMADKLAMLGYAPDAASETMDLLLTLRMFECRLDAMLDRLRPIWKGIEWWDSADWSEETFKEALTRYRGAAKEVKQ